MRLLGGAIGSFIAIVCFAIIIECPKKYLPLAGVIGAVGGTVYLFCLNIVKTDAVLAAFFFCISNYNIVTYFCERISRTGYNISYSGNTSDSTGSGDVSDRLLSGGRKSGQMCILLCADIGNCRDDRPGNLFGWNDCECDSKK